MEIPKRLKIGPYWWTVELVDDLTHDADRNKRLFGQCREGEQKILINKSLNPDGHFATFVHELAHAIDFVMMAGLKEKQVDRTATGWAMVLRDNDLWRWRGEATIAREDLAALAHEQWSGWMAYMLPKCTLNDDGSMTIPSGYVAALNRQMTTAYADLSEAEKDGDRAEADRVLALIGGES